MDSKYFEKMLDIMKSLEPMNPRSVNLTGTITSEERKSAYFDNKNLSLASSTRKQSLPLSPSNPAVQYRSKRESLFHNEGSNSMYSLHRSTLRQATGTDSSEIETEMEYPKVINYEFLQDPTLLRNHMNVNVYDSSSSAICHDKRNSRFTESEPMPKALTAHVLDGRKQRNLVHRNSVEIMKIRETKYLKSSEEVFTETIENTKDSQSEAQPSSVLTNNASADWASYIKDDQGSKYTDSVTGLSSSQDSHYILQSFTSIDIDVQANGINVVSSSEEKSSNKKYSNNLINSPQKSCLSSISNENESNLKVGELPSQSDDCRHLSVPEQSPYLSNVSTNTSRPDSLLRTLTGQKRENVNQLLCTPYIEIFDRNNTLRPQEPISNILYQEEQTKFFREVSNKLSLDSFSTKEIIKFFMRNGIFSAQIVDRLQTACSVCKSLKQKYLIPDGTNCRLVEVITRESLERPIEDHENILEIFTSWKEDFGYNKFIFEESPTRHILFTQSMQDEVTQILELNETMSIKPINSKWIRATCFIKDDCVNYSLKQGSKDQKDHYRFVNLKKVDFYTCSDLKKVKKDYKSPTMDLIVFKENKCDHNQLGNAYLAPVNALQRDRWLEAMTITKFTLDQFRRNHFENRGRHHSGMTSETAKTGETAYVTDSCSI